MGHLYPQVQTAKIDIIELLNFLYESVKVGEIFRSICIPPRPISNNETTQICFVSIII
jgi:hypothetical protein